MCKLSIKSIYEIQTLKRSSGNVHSIFFFCAREQRIARTQAQYMNTEHRLYVGPSGQSVNEYIIFFKNKMSLNEIGFMIAVARIWQRLQSFDVR